MSPLSRAGARRLGQAVTTVGQRPKGQWGGRREGAGAKPLSDEERLRRRLEREGIDVGPPADASEAMAALIGLSPRMAALRPDLVGRYEVVPPGEHMARFAATFCRYNLLGEVGDDGPALGDPVEFEEFEREFDDEAFTCDDRGRRVYKRAGLIIGRKNRKTTRAAIWSLYFASPADGEHRPLVVQAAGVKHQSGKLYDATKAFIDDPKYGSDLLKSLFVPMRSQILCPSIAGEIRQVAGDGDNNMSLDPHMVVMDELHTWKTPKQQENLRALTTSQGGRLDPFIAFITTEGDGDDNELALLMERVESSETTEREERRPGLTIFRDREAGLLVYRYAAPATIMEDGVSRKTGLADVEVIKLANPAPWRTLERLREDLADTFTDEAGKLRLYGNIRGSGEGRWISDDKIDQMIRRDVDIPDGATVVVAVDAAKTRDTTACSWSWRSPDGLIVQRSRVWSCRQDRPHDVFVDGGRLDNDLVRDFILADLMGVYTVKLLFFDERYFGDQAMELAAAGLTAVEMHQGKPEMHAAWDEWYHAVYEGSEPAISLGGDDGSLATLVRHVKNAVGKQTDRGWYVSKRGGKSSMLVIDGLAACVMSFYGVKYFGTYVRPKPQPWVIRR